MRSKATANLYLRLLCRFEPDGVLSFLKVNDSYDIDECLQYCSMHMIHTASAYLLERKGDLHGAFDVYLREICSLNAQLSDKGFAEMSLLHQADEACELAISVCIRSCEGRQGKSVRRKEQVLESLWYKLAITYAKAYRDAKSHLLSPEGRKPLLGYIEKVVGTAAPYLDPQLMAIYIIEEFQDIPLGELREVVHVLMLVSSFEHKTSKLTENISSQECLESIRNSYFRLTRSQRL